MAEITAQEYQLLLSAINSNQVSTSSLATNVSALSTKLAERYITREEDDRSDQRVKDEMYAYVREQCQQIRTDGEDVHRGLQEQLKLCFTVIGLLVMALISETGWIVTHLK